MPHETTISKHFATLPDPRIDRTKEHRLVDIISIALCAVLCGADNWVDIETFGQAKESWLRTFLSLPSGIPSHDTFGRVFARLDPVAFQRCFLNWVKTVAPTTTGQVAIDGKTLRGSHDRTDGKAALHLVSVWAADHGLVLGQVAVAGNAAGRIGYQAHNGEGGDALSAATLSDHSQGLARMDIEGNTVDRFDLTVLSEEAGLQITHLK